VADVACLDPALLVNPQTPVIELLARPAFLPTGRVVWSTRPGDPSASSRSPTSSAASAPARS
jgi:hypothetical protein